MYICIQGGGRTTRAFERPSGREVQPSVRHRGAHPIGLILYDIGTCAYMYIYKHVGVCMCVRLFVCICTHMSMYIYIYIHTRLTGREV